MTRLRSLVALATALAVAAALVACGDEGGGGDPRTVIDEATLRGIESGSLDLSLAVQAEGSEGGDVDASLSGPFQAGEGRKDLPEIDLTVDLASSVGGEEIDFEGGLVLLQNNAYVNYQGTDYEVDPGTFSFIEPLIAPQGKKGEAARTIACQEAAAGLKVSDFVDNLQDGGEADVDGTETTKVSGELDVAAAIDALLDLSEDPACGAQLGSSGQLPSKGELEKAKKEVKRGVEDATIDVYVGDDDIVRQISADLQLKAPKGSKEGPQSVDVEFELKLTGVNEEQEIAAPDGAKPLNDLFVKLRVNPLELFGILQNEGGAGVVANLLGKIAADVGGSEEGKKGGGSSQQAYLKCLQEVSSAVDLQKCLNLR